MDLGWGGLDYNIIPGCGIAAAHCSLRVWPVKWDKFHILWDVTTSGTTHKKSVGKIMKKSPEYLIWIYFVPIFFFSIFVSRLVLLRSKTSGMAAQMCRIKATFWRSLSWKWPHLHFTFKRIYISNGHIQTFVDSIAKVFRSTWSTCKSTNPTCTRTKNKISTCSEEEAEHDWRERTHEKGYSERVVHSSCLDTLSNNMTTTNTESQPGNRYKSRKLPKLELYSVAVTTKATGVRSLRAAGLSIVCVLRS